MLNELICDKFLKKKIIFSPGLNIIIGDDKASNSIGKSTFLMIIDLIMGGNTYSIHNRDVFENIGPHNYLCSFKNGEVLSYYCVKISDNSITYFECDKEYNTTKEITHKEYTKSLKEIFNITNSLSFRKIVGLFSRVWGKENLDVLSPLHHFKSETFSEIIENFLKLYEKYDSIADQTTHLNSLKKLKTTFNSSFNNNIIPKITKGEYNKNIKSIAKLTGNLDDLKNQIDSPIFNLNEEQNKKLIELKSLQSLLIDNRDLAKSKLENLKNQIFRKAGISKSEIKKIKTFFPEVNLNKLQEVEAFHNQVSSFLKVEIENTKNKLENKLSFLETDLKLLNLELEEFMKIFDFKEKKDSLFVEQASELVIKIKELEKKNFYFESFSGIDKDIKEECGNITGIKLKLLDLISSKINSKLIEIANEIDPLKSKPTLTLLEKKYSYTLSNDKGTGKTYENNLLLDLAILKTSTLPFIIHDSPLFKNIEIPVLEKIFKIYSTIGKPCFISLDEIKRYDETIQKFILKHKVLTVSKNKPLFGKLWNIPNSDIKQV